MTGKIAFFDFILSRYEFKLVVTRLGWIFGVAMSIESNRFKNPLNSTRNHHTPGGRAGENCEDGCDVFLKNDNNRKT